MNDVFLLQEQAALKIAGALNLHLTPQEKKAVQKRYTQNAEAYQAFLIGRVLVMDETRDKLEAARRYFEQALQFDPNYGPALAGLCNVETFYYRDLDPDPSHLQRAQDFARRAIAADPELADAHVALGQTYMLHYQYPQAVAEFRQATRLEPDNGFAWDQLAWALGYEQPPDALEAEKAGREAVRLAPSLPHAQYHLGRALLLQQRYDEATAAFRRSTSLGGNLESIGMAQLFIAQGKYDEALKLLQNDLSAKTGLYLYFQAVAYAGRGDKQMAVVSLQKSFDAGFRDFPAIDAMPYFNSLRDDPRFRALIQRYKNDVAGSR